jgi:hypothetical protein
MVSDDHDDTLTGSPRAAHRADVPEVDDTVVPMSRATRRAIERANAGVHLAPAVPQSAPTYYAFRLGEQRDWIPLDRPAYIGRSPSSPRIVSGVMPRLVRVESPNREVSSTHLEIRQLGASVIVTDLTSTNGSIVSLPGSVPRTLRQGESVVVSPGTLVDIGDDNVLHILPMQPLR